jgi:hypothetical protein
LCRPKLVDDMLSLIGRGDPIVTRTSEQIQADKARVAKVLAGSKPTKPTSRRKLVSR